MSPHSKGLLVQLLLVLCVRQAEYSKVDDNTEPSGCQNRMKGCGTFQEPIHDVGYYKCSFMEGFCGYRCFLRCPNKMILHKRSQSKETFICNSKTRRWTRKNTPRTFCKAKWPVREVIQNLHKDHIEDLSYLVNALLNSSYFYLGMASFYDRADVALPGIGKLMTEQWSESMNQARSVLEYVNKRGGYIMLFDVPRPSSYEQLMLRLSQRPGLMGIELALQAARTINDHVLGLHRLSPRRHSDPHLKHYLEDGLMSKQVDTIKVLSDHVTKLKEFSDDDYTLGEYVLDTELSA